jgi:CDI immunity protein
MSLPNLFKSYPNDPLRIVKNCFESMNNSSFIEQLELLVNRKVGGGYPCGYIFPEQLDEIDDRDVELFIGVLCWYFEDEIVVSEQDFYDIMVMACQRYIELYPKTKKEIERILSQWQFSKKSF